VPAVIADGAEPWLPQPIAPGTGRRMREIVRMETDGVLYGLQLPHLKYSN
jgi:hypothetical protein